MKKLLVIDDDPDILEAIELILTGEGYSTEITLNGQEAYSRVKTFEPDLIILDYLLSGNDGRTICSNLKKDSKTKHIPIIMFSAYPTAKDSIHHCGADSFLSKPFSVDRLLSEIKRFISDPSEQAT